jgi:DNA replication and repair protein RecF
MGYTSVGLYHFRNLQDDRIAVDARDVFLIGDNGQGKTNFLESIYMLSYGGSFRAKSDELICRNGEGEMSLRAVLQTEDAQHDIRYKWQNRRKHIELDGSAISDRKELVHIMPCIVFAHDDIDFVAGPPEMQRYFFDQSLSLYDPLYIDVLRRYRRILRARNDSLKESRTDLLEIYNRQLAQHGLELQRHREHAVDAFNDTFTAQFAEIAGLPYSLEIRYAPSWKHEQAVEDVEERLRRQRDQDLRFGTTTSGPQRDRFVFSADGQDFTLTASTGQLRLVSLVLRVAQAVFFHSAVGRRPLLLLDDVLLELDQTRRERFLQALPDYEQAFFTFLPNEQYKRYLHDDAMVYEVKDGVLTPP